MRRTFTTCLLALSLTNSGCALITDGVHAVKTELADAVDDGLEHHRNRKWAATVWDNISCKDARHCTQDYAQGFKDGFVDYVYYGDVEPPPVAPARYRRYRYQTPLGFQAIEDWFAGYRHGVAVARETSHRRWVTGPMSAPLLMPKLGPPTPADE